MKECDLYIPTRDRLISTGHIVHAEVFGTDIIAVKDGKITAVEMKLCLSDKLVQQCYAASRWADFIIAVIASKPVTTSVNMHSLRHLGCALWQCIDGKIHQKIRVAKPQPWSWHKAHRHRAEKLEGRRPAMPHETAGIPSCPALREQRLVRIAADSEREMT